MGRAGEVFRYNWSRMEAKRYDPLKVKAVVEWNAANPPSRAYQPHTYVAAVLEQPNKIECWPRSLRQWERRLYRHQNKYERFIRIHGWKIPPDAPMRHDRRYWEARICGVDPNEFCQWFWFCGLRELTIADLCFYSRACRRDTQVQSRREKK